MVSSSVMISCQQGRAEFWITVNRSNASVAANHHYRIVVYLVLNLTMNEALNTFLSREKIPMKDFDPLNARLHIQPSKYNNLLTLIDTYYKVYQRLRPKHHPDKGGDTSTFNRITIAMGTHRVLMDILQGDKNHGDLKSSYLADTMAREAKPPPMSMEEFERKWADTDAHAFDDHHHQGYGDMMVPRNSDITMNGTVPQRRNIDIERMSESTPRRFNDEFRSQKQAKVGTQIMPYMPPMAANDNVAGSTTTFLELGRTVDNFTVPINVNSINYTDYRDAFEQSFLIDESHVRQEQPRNVEEMIRIRKDATMSRDQQLAVEKHDMILEIDELKRLEKLRNQHRKYITQ
jgi:hypothetical protein